MSWKRPLVVVIAVAVAVALLSTAAPAGAHTGHTATFSVANSSVNAYTATSGSISFGATEPSAFTFDFEAGMRLVSSPTPLDEETIGSVSVHANWSLLGVCFIDDHDFTLTWETSMVGAPAGAVAHWEAEGSVGYIGDIWVIEEATDDYTLDFDVDESRTCSVQPANAGLQLDTIETTVSGGHVYRNPSTAGCYTVTFAFDATDGTAHAGSDDESIGGGTC